MATTHAHIYIRPLKECIRRGGRAMGDRWDHGLKILAGIRCTLCCYRGRNSSQGGWGSFPTGGAEHDGHKESLPYFPSVGEQQTPGHRYAP